MAELKNLDKTMFWRLGAMKFSEEFKSLTALTDVCTYDATMYTNNAPKKCMIRDTTSFRPHLVRHLNLLDNEPRDYIQNLWNKSNDYITELGFTPYQCFLVITNNSFSVKQHSHGDHMGDTITVVSVEGDEPINTFLCIGNNTKILYPNKHSKVHAICFDSNAIHYTYSNDRNYYFHFVYDLCETVNISKNIWTEI